MIQQPHPHPNPSKKRNFMLRLATALVLAPIVLGLIVYGGLPYHLFVILMLGLALHEWWVIGAGRGVNTGFIVGLAGLCTSYALLVNAQISLIILPLLCVFLIQFALLRHAPRKNLWALAGLPYMVLALWAFLTLYDEGGWQKTLYLMLSVWAVDTGAYFFGRAIGGAKLAPRISPNKTWAGLIGGMFTAAIVGYLWCRYVNVQQPLWALVIGCVIAIIAQAGDLAESAYKRAFGVKDSGNILPGHGGILDRVDGLLSAFPFFVVFERLIGVSLQWW